ncbi:hypothetical protein [Defluviimonas salinarum]|uniref:Uncharacterized protein n=1 Tax=Defluviimonas salinarum TaxID=2992147 RepID=A0ABT3J9U7_9RHOB|nr:hypothetical protein [Defluviimonas salinarum]MCW3784308.1 hypothetical protein [Defluviimonas salinarum]
MRHYDYETRLRISVHSETWTPADLEAGDTDKRETLYGREEIEIADLDAIVAMGGFDTPSSSVPDARTWFENSTPPMTRDRIEKGIELHYSLHIHEVDGRPADTEDIVAIGELLGIVFGGAPDLEDRRRARADAAFEAADFGGIDVAGTSGWETDGEHRLARTVYLDYGGETSHPMRFAVEFKPWMALHGEPEFELPEIPEAAPKIFGYYVDLDERGEFRADVRDAEGKTVFEIHCSDEEGWDIFEDGFMKNKEDISGLQEHLSALGILGKGAELLSMSAFESRLEADRECEPGF